MRLSLGLIVALSIVTDEAFAYSWISNVYNQTTYTFSASVDSNDGNVWFQDSCPNAENGPCNIAPLSVTGTKYTYSMGNSSGTFSLTSNQSSVEMDYDSIGTNESPKFSNSANILPGALPGSVFQIAYNDPSTADITITGPQVSSNFISVDPAMIELYPGDGGWQVPYQNVNLTNTSGQDFDDLIITVNADAAPMSLVYFARSVQQVDCGPIAAGGMCSFGVSVVSGTITTNATVTFQVADVLTKLLVSVPVTLWTQPPSKLMTISH